MKVKLSGVQSNVVRLTPSTATKPFFDDVAGRGLRASNCYEFGVTIVVDFFDLTGAINVSLHQVAADARVVFESSFEVDVSALLEFSEPG